MTGRIFDIQRFSLHDGPGIRTTVFFQGCPLRCQWCHNPEGLIGEPRIAFVVEDCIGCGQCVRVCPRRAHRIEPSSHADAAAVHVLDRTRCEVCGACVAACDAGALELVGREVAVAEVMAEVLRDGPFYGPSGGGPTLSGGEPLLQIDFAEALLRAAKAAGLHCCVETSGFAPWLRLERLALLVDLFLYDFKETDPARHVQYTGCSHQRIVDNLRLLHERGARILLRCPIIPGCNDREDHFAGIATLARELPRLEGVQILPYHPLGKAKRQRLGLPPLAWPDAITPDRATVDAWLARLEEQGVPARR